MYGRYLVNFDSSEIEHVETEILSIGGGIAGLYTAWQSARAGFDVMLLTKRTISDTNTDRAQGGIAAAIGESDSPELHYKDTIAAGAGLCDEAAVRILVTEGTDRVQELIDIGANFDYYGEKLAMTKEGAHSKRRILHAHGDATGAEISRVLLEQVKMFDNATIFEQHFVVDLLVKENECCGVLVFDESTGNYRIFWAKAVILATGGAGRVYNYTTNPTVATGDGIAMAYRAGAEVMDVEFVQFHPTTLVLPGVPRFLISEAVRGEGAVLRNSRGERFMPSYHGMAELAPRDIVARAILSEMAKTGENCVYLDLTHLNADKIRERFPTITKTCLKYGLDIAKDLIPVAPAAHYIMGGVKTNIDGETSIKHLYACGENACLAVHGANRLASNSLLDGLVFGKRIVELLKKQKRLKKELEVKKTRFVCEELVDAACDFSSIESELKVVMNENVGPLRTSQRLMQALSFFDRQECLRKYKARNSKEMEVQNMLEVGRLIAEAAMMRTESRGGHFRLDFPETVLRWKKHIILRK
ncbi:L-aspartate oxidase [Peptococcaceae bacterium]|nr:L-aspartate oxidase [Peptococcaceae bacterium]